MAQTGLLLPQPAVFRRIDFLTPAAGVNPKLLKILRRATILMLPLIASHTL